MVDNIKLNVANMRTPYPPLDALVIGFLAATRATGKTTWLNKFIEYLQTKSLDIKLLIVEISPQPVEVDLYNRSMGERILLEERLGDLLQAIVDSKEFLRDMSFEHLVKRHKNVDVLSLVENPRGARVIKIDSVTERILVLGQTVKRHGIFTQKALQYLPRILHKFQEQEKYNAILIDFPEFFFPGVLPLVSLSNYLVIPFPVADIEALEGIFSINDVFMGQRIIDSSLKDGFIVPMFAGRAPDTYRCDLQRLNWIFDSYRVWPLIPDCHYLDNSGKYLGKEIQSGYQATFERFIELTRGNLPYHQQNTPLERRIELYTFLRRFGGTHPKNEVVERLLKTNISAQEKIIAILDSVQKLSVRQHRMASRIRTKTADCLLGALQAGTRYLSCEKILKVLEVDDYKNLDYIIEDLVASEIPSRSNLSKILGQTEDTIRRDAQSLSLTKDHSLSDCKKRIRVVDPDDDMKYFERKLGIADFIVPIVSNRYTHQFLASQFYQQQMLDKHLDDTLQSEDFRAKSV